MEHNGRLLGKYLVTPFEHSLRSVREKVWFAGDESPTARKFLRRTGQVLRAIHDERFGLRVITWMLKGKYPDLNTKDVEILKVQNEAVYVAFAPRELALDWSAKPEETVDIEHELLTRNILSVFNAYVPELNIRVRIYFVLCSAYNKMSKTLALTHESPKFEIQTLY